MQKTSKLSSTRRAFIAGSTSSLFVPAVARSQPLPRMQVSFATEVLVYRMRDNPTTRDLISMLPAELEISDFSTNEKIVRLPRRLDEGGYEAFDDETPGDLCYFLGWGNLAMFHDDFTFRNDLIRLGHVEGSLAPLRHKGTYAVRIEML